jgi:hypothetical protein
VTSYSKCFRPFDILIGLLLCFFMLLDGGNSKHLIHINIKTVIISVTHFKLSNVGMKKAHFKQINLCSTELLYQIYMFLTTVKHRYLSASGKFHAFTFHLNFSLVRYKVHAYKYNLKTYFGASFSNQSFLDL